METKAREKLKEGQEKMKNAEAGSAKEDAIAEFDKFSQDVMKLKETEDSSPLAHFSLTIERQESRKRSGREKQV